MKVSDIIAMFGDVDIPNKYLIDLGLIEEDRLIDAKEVEKLTGIKNPYAVINKLKAAYKLSYDESRIPLSVLKEHYHLI